MTLSKQIQKVVNYNKCWVLFHIVTVLFILLFFFNKTTFLQFKFTDSISLGGTSVVSVVSFLMNLFLILKRLDKICYLQILKLKIEKGSNKEKEYAAQVFNEFLKKKLLKSDEFTLSILKKE